MPATRSANGKRAGSFEVERDIGEESSSGEGESVHLGSIEGHLKQVEAGVRRLKHQLKTLRKENESTKLELEIAKQESARKRSQKRRSNSSSEDDANLAKIHTHDLVLKLRELEAENHRQKKRIDKFKRKELREEVKDLEGPKNEEGLERGGGVGSQEIDPEHRMRKLLRAFSDLMLVATIAEDMSQTCPICFETLRLNQCSALECQHLICRECLPKMSKGANETVICAECRKVSSRDELQLVHMTERDRWDELLAVAQAWDAFDGRGKETTEEEAEENFINDDTGTSEVSSEAGNEIKIAEHTLSEVASVADDDGRLSTPPPVPHRSFSQSPAKEKRKMLEQLAEERAQKRRK